MTTRLDRLVLLLDTGSTKIVRSTAAKQIGQVQKQHPDELYPLLSRVLVHLNSKNWDTRIAAGEAIEAICENVPSWEPASSNQEIDSLEGLLSFNTLDIDIVLERGQPLLSSAGQEFDGDLSDLDPKERLAIQKKRLKEKLGIATQFMDVDFFDENDVTVIKSSGPKESKVAVEQVVSKVSESKEDPFAGLSARERNQLKRKMKMASKQGKDIKYSDISSSAAQKKRKIENSTDDPNTTVVAFKPKPDISTLGVYSSGDEWPFEGLCEQLSFDLFSPKWETRHGAAIGLRQVLKVHGSGYGKVIGIEKSKNEKRHYEILEDLAIRLLCVLALDQFTDFVGDQAVVPVRETCAQTLGVVMQLCTPELCIRVVNEGLLKLISYHSRQTKKDDNAQKWAVRLAALIGLKYWMAVRQDLLHRIMSPMNGVDSAAFLAIVEGIKDHNDDVRAVATSSLLPICDLLVEIFPPAKIFNSIVICLWDSLQELDDLTAATSFVMDLLSNLLRKPVIAKILRDEATQFLEKLVPQLFPFFRHAITSVRLAVLRSLLTLSELSIEAQTPPTWIKVDLLRLLFQNFILEEKMEVLELSLQLWTQLCTLLDSVEEQILQDLIKSTLAILFGLLMSPIGTPIDARLFISYSGSGGRRGGVGGSGLNIPPQDKAMLNQDLIVVSYENVMKGRLAAGTAVGQLVSTLLVHPYVQDLQGNVFQWINAYLLSGHAFHRIFVGVVIQHWVETTKKSLTTEEFFEKIPEAQGMWQQIIQILADASAGGTLLFLELQTQLAGLYQDCTTIQNLLAQSGHRTPQLPPLQFDAQEFFSVDSAEYFLDKVCIPLQPKMSDVLMELYRKASAMKLATRQLQVQLDTRVYSSLAAAAVSFGSLPQKLNPIIRNLMTSVQTEDNMDLQRRSSEAVARMLAINVQVGGKANTNDKIVKNCCVYLCSDPEVVGLLADNSSVDGIITMAELKSIKIIPKRAPSKKKGIEIDADAAEAVKDAASALVNEAERVAKKVLHRGAEAVLENLCTIFKENVFSSVPALWDFMSVTLFEYAAKMEHDPKHAVNPGDPSAQSLLDSLHVIEIVSKYLSEKLYSQLMSLFLSVRNCLTCPYNLVRQLASKCIASIAKYVKVPAMIKVIDQVVPLTNRSTIDTDRQGGVECLYHIIEALQDQVLAYLIFLMAPLLSRMSDPNEDVRFIATNAFAQLVKLAPLEAGVPNPPGFTKELVDRKNQERKFIGQLIGTERVQEYELPVAIAAELRSYQKEGVSWLAFLNRYGLHGILCDDMGLGKTLQAICIISSDHYYRNEEYKKTKSLDFAHCPTLIVCPSPLTGHWFFEIKKYAEFMQSVIYCGDRSQRLAIRKKMMENDIVIVSYEVLRNDIDYFSTLRFNYCCLDEGHVIKNPSTKLTKAVKSVRAFHRLILSGTPVQNQVLDLWSLFDFLMPGFLGTEAQFNERFGKPIQASRDAKASSKEQERGALALEALHKQVLPFLMRRMKEDVLEDLPPKIIQDYYCELSDVQKLLYDEFSTLAPSLDDKDGEAKKQHVFQALQYLRKLCNHPSLVLSDKHPQYQKVIDKLRDEKRTINDIRNAPKLMVLQQLLLDCGIGVERNESTEATAPHRVLIFAQVKQMLDMIQNDLFKKHMPSVTYMRLDGQVTDPVKRHEMIQTFNQDPSIDCLLLTTSVGGLGLNLTGADTVIFMEHDWNPQKDLQAMDRAHRIGQKRVVNVYRLITKGTLEEKIMGLQKFKLNLSSSIINSDNTGIHSMDTDQILDLFSLEGSGKEEKKSGGAKEAIESLQNLWDEGEYDDLEVDGFLAGLKK